MTILAGGQLQLLTLAGDTIQGILLAKLEMNAADIEPVVGQQLGSIAVAAFEVGRLAHLIEREALAVVGQRQGLCIGRRRLRLHSGVGELHLVGPDAIRIDRHI